MIKEELVSIIMPTYNSEKFVEESIESIQEEEDLQEDNIIIE